MIPNTASDTRTILYLGVPSSLFDVAAKTVTELVRNSQLWQFQTPGLLIARLSECVTNPWLVLIDAASDPGNLEVLDWIKNHAAFHFTPVIAFTGETEPVVGDVIARGAFGAIKAMNPGDFRTVLNRRARMDLNASELRELDQVFQEELATRIANCSEYLETLNDPNVRRMLHAFHTIKGSAKALEFPALARFMHSAETFLTRAAEAGLVERTFTRDIIREVISFLRQVADAMITGQIIPLPPAELQNSLGSVIPVQPKAVLDESPSIPKSVSALKMSSLLRISEDRVDDIENRLRRLLEIRMRLSRFSNQLKSEFNDEPFVLELETAIEDLQDETVAALELILNLRLVPVQRLKAYAERILFDTTSQLNKAARLEFSAPPTMAVEPKIFECLETAALHLIRNAVDHGLEDIEIRARSAKDPIGKVAVEFRDFGRDKIMAVFEDDGKGIDVENIRSAVIRRGALHPTVLERMKPQEIAQLVFSENLSTIQVPSEISGRGIGLSLVKQMITDLGGMIDLYYEEARGTRFTLVLPRILK